MLNLEVFNAALVLGWQNIRLLDVWKLAGMMWGGTSEEEAGIETGSKKCETGRRRAK